MKYFCIISHTHWDREWYMPLDAFRLKLVDLIDRCLVTLKNYPEFIFHLDAQTIVLEDYLSIRASKKKELKKYIKEGRLIVGPWYIQNDFYLTSGEATVRNLLTGTRIAEEYGNCAKVGYAPDQFGNISQLPQILSGFGIDNFIFGRGYSEYELVNDVPSRKKTKTEFIWEGADGTKALAIHMCYWYNNAQRFSEKVEASKRLVEVIRNMFSDVALTPYLLLMNGVDHLEAQDNLLPILEKLNPLLEDGEVRQYTMQEYVDKVKEYTQKNEVQLSTHKGELRNGSDGEILKGTLSSRSYLKTSNVKAQNMLEAKLEPIYAIAELAGMNGVYSVDHFRYMWKELMKNHPHDSICGCSRDEIHSHMEDNYKRIYELSSEMLKRGLRVVAEHMDLSEFSDENYVVTVTNTTEKLRSELVTVQLDIPLKDNINSFELFDNDNNKIPFTVMKMKQTIRDVFSPINLPGSFDIMRYEICFMANSINPFAVKGYIVKKSDKALELVREHKCSDKICMENDNLAVVVQSNGQVDITDKNNKKTYINAIDIEETGDRGDSYIYFDTFEKPIHGSQFPADVIVVENNELIQRIKISRTLCVPAYYDYDALRRSTTLAPCRVDLVLTLKKGSEFIEIQYTADNTAKDHRIRLLVNTGIDCANSIADIPFDIVSHTSDDHFVKTQSKVLPNTSFALLEANNQGIAVLTEGTHEYEHIESSCSLAFTLLRGTGVIYKNSDLTVTNGEVWDCPENQCIREISGRIAISPYQGDYVKENIPLLAKQFKTPLVTFATSCDHKKFAGGRPAVQDAQLEELFFLPDPYKAVKIKDNYSYVNLVGENIVVTALKKAEEEDGIVLRFFNYTNDSAVASLTSDSQQSICNLNEEILSKMDEDKITTRGKEIVTVKLN